MKKRTKIKKELSRTSVRIMVVLLVFTMLITLPPAVYLKASNTYNSNSQTKFSDISEFQKDRWARIQAEIFEEITLDDSEYQTLESNAGKLSTYHVSDNNDYFNWKDTGLEVWDGKINRSVKPSTETYTYQDSYISGENGENIPVSSTVEYQVYNVTRPQQFRYIMREIGNKDSDLAKQNVKINLMSDLDMGGQNGQIWRPVKVAWSPSVYIEGNGHSIYNLKIYSEDDATALFGQAPTKFIVKNIGFCSSMVLGDNEREADGEYGELDKMKRGQAALIAAFAGDKMYFYNVHSTGGYFQVKSENTQGIGGLIGRKQKNVSYIWSRWVELAEKYNSTYFGTEDYATDAGDTFFENCSTERYYMYGGDHIGGLSSYMGTSYETKVKYDADFPEIPESFVYQQDGHYEIFPIMIKNCYSIDCEIFSTGHDSGAFISCGDSIVAKNCFSNNTIYARDNTAGFIGRVATKTGKRLYDDGKSCTINSYFDSCWSSGIVEGKTCMGGLLASIMGIGIKEILKQGKILLTNMSRLMHLVFIKTVILRQW